MIALALNTDTERTPEEFHIDNDEKVNWLLRKLANIEAEKARVQAQAAEIVRQLDADAQRLLHLYGGELEAYCRQKLAATGNRRRSVAFLQGTCAFRTVLASVKVADAFAAMQYAKNAGMVAALRVTETLDAAAYRNQAEKHLAETGELLPGIETTPKIEGFNIRFGKNE